MSEKIRPFVKWAGGKGSLIPQLNNFYPYELKNGIIERYIEPFVGGGAVLIDILQKYDVREAYAFDINIDLIKLSVRFLFLLLPNLQRHLEHLLR